VLLVQVMYNVDGFLEKNRDTLSDNIMNCMKRSEARLVYELFSPVSEFGQLELG
jgi:myosin heavy subunit